MANVDAPMTIEGYIEKLAVRNSIPKMRRLGETLFPGIPNAIIPTNIKLKPIITSTLCNTKLFCSKWIGETRYKVTASKGIHGVV